MPSQYSASIKINGDKFNVNDLSILHFSYKVLWDRGIKLDLLVFDPDCALHKALSDMDGDPTPQIEFQLAYLPSLGQGGKYANQGTVHQLNIVKVGQVTTPGGLCIRIRAVDKASILLREQVLNFSANGVKANAFIKNLAAKVGIQADIPETNDRAGTHRALRQKPIDVIRYELDRILSDSVRPISLQFDDRKDQLKLRGFVELYDMSTQVLDGLAGGVYNYGVAQAANKSTQVRYGSTAYHFELDQDYRPAIWGHNVSVDHLDALGNSVSGEVKAKLSAILGVQGKSLERGGARIHLPSAGSDNPTDDYSYAKAIMTNSVFQSEMSTTRGSILIDPDFKALDSVDILNRKHVVISIGNGNNDTSGHAIIPSKAIIMGWEHRMNLESSFTRLFVRRGS